MTGAAKARRPRERSEAPDLTLVRPESEEALKKALEKTAPEQKAAPKAAPSSAAPPVATTQDPWRHLHPSRVWPD